MNSYAKFGGAARRYFSAICEKPMGGTYVPPGRARDNSDRASTEKPEDRPFL